MTLRVSNPDAQKQTQNMAFGPRRCKSLKMFQKPNLDSAQHLLQRNSYAQINGVLVTSVHRYKPEEYSGTVSASMKALEEPRERALLVGFSLIIMPDMTRYAGDGAGIKAITGGDKVAIDPKHKPPYSMRIPAVVLAVNNNEMSFSDRSGGISLRWYWRTSAIRC